MTLEEAITHAREIAQRGGECAEDHEQLAEWLEELRGIVRCRDCVHMLSIDLSDYYGNPEPNLEVCKRVRGVHLNAEPDGFCAWAERREQ